MARLSRRLWFVLLLLFSYGFEVPPVAVAQLVRETVDTKLLTTAELSGFQATSSYDDVLRFCDNAANQSSLIHRFSMGESVEGREIPLLVVSKREVQQLDDLGRQPRMVIFVMANIHAGEVCGKEALMILVRQLMQGQHHELLDKLTLVVAPIYNVDGNERISRRNRSSQVGPVQGVGERTNSQGLDLNRDHVKLESPEAQALVDLINRCDPMVVIDCHTTNGSQHGYTLTFDGPRHPATDASIREYVREKFLPAVAQRMQETSGYVSQHYGNFTQEKRRWETYPAEPRFNTQYVGLRQRIGILSEAYAYAPFEDRVRATLFFVTSCLENAAADRGNIFGLLQTVRNAARVPHQNRERAVEIPIDFAAAPFDKPYVILGDDRQGKAPQHSVEFWGTTRVLNSVVAPYAYLVPGDMQEVIAKLRQHGVELDLLREDIRLDVDLMRVLESDRQEEEFQGHQLVRMKVETRNEPKLVSAGTVVVRTNQSLNALIVNLLEPESRDGLATWNHYDKFAAVGQTLPVMKLRQATPLHLSPLPSPLQNSSKREISFESVYGDNRPDFTGDPVRITHWRDDQTFLQEKEGELYWVSADHGKITPVFDRAKFSAALDQQTTLESEDVDRVAAGEWLQMSDDGTSVLFRHYDDLFFAKLDGEQIVRLTRHPGEEELAELSPDGKRVAFVRDSNLYVVAVADAVEQQLTHDGDGVVRNGKADWVYFEEIYRRNWKAFRWSPTSDAILFQRFDDSQVDTFVVLDDKRAQQKVEQERYPKAGTTNPRVQLGRVSIHGGAVEWADLTPYTPDSMLLVHFGWKPDGDSYFYVQDRAQRWLDIRSWPRNTIQSNNLFRETTNAWVENPGAPVFLDDGSFLLTSERTGWKHIYHFHPDGRLIRPVTHGKWEVRELVTMDALQETVLFTAMKASSLAANLYRVTIDGRESQRLTPGPGDHRVSVSPHGERFVDSVSDRRSPTQVMVRDQDGRRVRQLDINPVPDLELYELLPIEFVQFQTRDGRFLEGSLIKPANFDPQQRYPVWMLTYGGPHSPTMSDSWRGGRKFEQLLARMGVIAFRCDPRSASGKSAKSSWTAYRQLGVSELRDLEDAAEWIAEKSYVDSHRIGLSGHSYGGFLTAYALTHSTKFAAGIAGAPVTDWRNYDTIYTERYMSTPQENPEGYQKTSVVAAAAKLHGELLIIHGARDDNVHLANTLQLADALQKAEKPFEMMIYPQSRHGISGKHYHQLRLDFIRRGLGLDDASASIP